jgi:hypothetical protein
LENQSAPPQGQSGGFLDNMRGAIFGQSQGGGSVPNVRPPEVGSRPVWNSGQVLQQTGQSDGGHYDQGGYGQAGYGQPYGGPQAPGGMMGGGGMMGSGPMGGGMMGGGGGSFLGTAAATAAGMVGGSLLLNSFRGMMGGNRQAFGDAAATGDRSPWSDQSNSSLARDAGINNIGNSRDLAAQDRAQDLAQDRDDDNSRAGLFDSASNDEQDDADMDSDDFGNDGDSDFA